MRKTEIVAWTKEWIKIYFLEEEILKGILKEELLTIFHIGSTSIPTTGYAGGYHRYFNRCKGY